MPYLLAVILLALLTTPATAGAVERYADPDGSGVACTTDAPCTYADAVTLASGNDEVILLPGDHLTSSAASNTDPITVRGAVGQPRPRIIRTGTAGYALNLNDPGAQVRDLEIVTSSEGFGLFFAGGTAQRITVRGTGTGNACVLASNAQLRDILCSAEGTGSGVLIFGNAGATTVTLRNVTAHAAGDGSAVPPGEGIYAQAQSGGTLTVNATNVIAWGAQRDVFAVGDATSESIVNIDHSNYNLAQESGTCTLCDVNAGAGHQTDEPVFRNAASDDFRQDVGGPTIDAGVNGDDTGRTDADGLTRTIHGTTDIGAYEQTIAPTIQTGEPTGATETAVTLNATVTPHHEATTWRAELGTTTAYGNATPDGNLDPVGTAAPVTATFNGLVPGTTYHYRLVATNLRGTTIGPDRTFTTAGTAPGPAGQTPGGQTPGGTVLPGGPGGVVIVEPAQFMGMTLAKRRIPVRRGIARVRVTCGAVLGSCAGKVRITTRRRGRTATLGRRSFSGLGAGSTRTLRIRLIRSARGKRWRVRVVARARNEDGPLRSTSVRTRLAPRR